MSAIEECVLQIRTCTNGSVYQDDLAKTNFYNCQPFHLGEKL